MRNTFYLFPCRTFFLFLTFLFFFSQIINSQTWVRKVDGYSMWSIGKDYAGNIYAGTTGSARGIFKSTDSGDTWTNMFSTGTSNYLDIACDSLNNVYVANVSNGVIYSTDGGQSFNTIPASTFGGANVNTVACGKNGHIFVGVTNGGIWRSTDFGTTFANTGAQTNTIVSFAIDRSDADRIYAGSSSTSLNGFYISTDGGLTFGASTISLNIWQILQTSGNEIYIATTSSPYPFNRSTDSGLTWTAVGSQPAAMRGATLDLIEDIYTAGNGGVYKSTNDGVTFINHNFTSSSNKIISYDYKIMVCATGTTNGGVWIYSDSTLIPVELKNFIAIVNNNSVELTWSTSTELNNRGFEVERGNNNKEYQKIGFVPGYGTTTEPHSYSFADHGVLSGKYYYRLRQIDFDGSFKYSKVMEADIVPIYKFNLDQNYPNPFNPSTVINYEIAQPSLVTLKVYDILGNEIAVLVDEEKAPGRYSVEFSDKGGSTSGGNAYSLPSGIYFYQLITDSFVESKKMILLK